MQKLLFKHQKRSVKEIAKTYFLRMKRVAQNESDDSSSFEEEEEEEEEGEEEEEEEEEEEGEDENKPRQRSPKVCREAFEEIKEFIEARKIIMESLRNTRSAKEAAELLETNKKAKEIWDQCDWPNACETNSHKNALDVVITVLSYCLQTKTIVTGDNHACPKWMKGVSKKNYIVPKNEETSLYENHDEAVKRIKELGEAFYKQYAVDKHNYTSSEDAP